MSRTKGSLFTSVLDVNKRFPLDSRMLVQYKADLINPETWITKTLTSEATFNGMIVAVNRDGDNNGVYVLSDRTLLTQDNYNSYLEASNDGADTTEFFRMWTKLANIQELEMLAERVAYLEENGTGGGSGEVSRKELEQAIAEAKEIRVKSSAELPNQGSKDTFYKCDNDGYTYIWNGNNYEKFAVHEIKEINGGDAFTLY